MVRRRIIAIPRAQRAQLTVTEYMVDTEEETVGMETDSGSHARTAVCIGHIASHYHTLGIATLDIVEVATHHHGAIGIVNSVPDKPGLTRPLTECSRKFAVQPGLDGVETYLRIPFCQTPVQNLVVRCKAKRLQVKVKHMDYA